MAKKLVLVPEDMYRGLLVQKKSTNSTNDTHRLSPLGDGDINLEFTRKNMLKARDQRGKSKNISAKNTDYNQELRRYLRFRKEMREKPIKVKLSNGANVIVKGSNGQNDSFENHREVESALLNDDGDLEATNSPYLESHRLFETPKIRNSRLKKTTSELSSNDKKDILLRYLYANAESLGITQKGEVLRSMGGVPMKTSSLEAIVERLLDPARPGSSSPPGTNILRGRLTKDLKYNQLINKLKEAGQYGKGFDWQEIDCNDSTLRANCETRGRQERKRDFTSRSVVAQHKFRPTKW